MVMLKNVEHSDKDRGLVGKTEDGEKVLLGVPGVKMFLLREEMGYIQEFKKEEGTYYHLQRRSNGLGVYHLYGEREPISLLKRVLGI